MNFLKSKFQGREDVALPRKHMKQSQPKQPKDHHQRDYVNFTSLFGYSLIVQAIVEVRYEIEAIYQDSKSELFSSSSAPLNDIIIHLSCIIPKLIIDCKYIYSAIYNEFELGNTVIVATFLMTWFDEQAGAY